MSSDLADDYRLVAMDLRGHGLSDKPREGYSDSRLWADDVNAAIEALRLDHPILCGWSYGPLVILDYIRHYGEAHISGLSFVDALTKLGSEAAMAVFTPPEVLSLVRGFFSTDADRAYAAWSRWYACSSRKSPRPKMCTMLGYNVSVPPYVRQALFSRTLDNDDILAKIGKPVLITHGAADAIVKPSAADQHRAALAHAQVHMMPHAGHAPFWEDAPSFNQRLRRFSESL
jgi:non-heme chloroperoxidase